jgi:hypothetical protein
LAKNAKSIPIPKEDMEWRGRDAARTLAEAERIKADPLLSKLAAKHAQSIADEKMQEANSMVKVAKQLKGKATAATKPAAKAASKPKTATKPAAKAAKKK